MEINEWVNNYMTDDEWWRTYNDYYWNARINYKDGVDDGRVEGIKENKIEVAKNMLRHNDTITYIKEITGLSIKKIKDLKKSIEEE